MSPPDSVPLSRSQQNLYNGVLHDGDPTLYLIGKTYRFRPLPVPRFLAALEAVVLGNPVQLCVLESAAGEVYPQLALRLSFDDIVRVRAQDGDHPGGDLSETWAAGILNTALVRYTVWTDGNGDVCGMDVYSHHIVVDGGATGIIEADLARHLAADGAVEAPCVSEGLAKLVNAHRREQAKVDESLQRVAAAVQRELADEARLGAPGQGARGTPGAAAKGVLRESVIISGVGFDAIMALSETKQVPVNVLVSAAAVAVDASVRQSTDGLVVHAVDNRFGDPELNVATCLVNSVAHAVRFAPFASVQDVVRGLDRSYVKAVRRRWLREEHYRRMYLAINRTTHVEALTLNFIRETCAPGLRPFLLEAPAATHIGPVEGMTVASVLDEERRTLNLAIWDRADLAEPRAPVAPRIAAALESMAAQWNQPIATTVDEWMVAGPDGAVRGGDAAVGTPPPAAPAWFAAADGPDVHTLLDSRPSVRSWLNRVVRDGSTPGDVVVFADDDTDSTVDLMIACHLAGCGYSVCDTPDQIPLRANAIEEHGDGLTVRTLDTSMELGEEESWELADTRIAEVAGDTSLATKTAYIMPTSGSTGQPKLVRVNHGSLALFCAAVRVAYGWMANDRILQCAPLTSDISVEEIFGAAYCGARLTRTAAMKSGDLDSLAKEVVASAATVVDLPTAVWHLLCEDSDALAAIRESRLRQIVVGGEAIRPAAVDKWADSDASRRISLVSTYGPTETTVVVTHLPIDDRAPGGTRLRVGRPIVADSVCVAFGEVVIVGDLVSAGYLGIDDRSFGTVTTGDGVPRRAFATADRVTVDSAGFPVFAGRKDAVVKISGKRVDLADVTRRIAEDPAVSDVAVELHDGSLGVWFETARTRESADDVAAATRIRLLLTGVGVSSFFVVGVPNIPRKPNGKVDSEILRTLPQFVGAVRDDTDAEDRASQLAQVWSRRLGTVLRADSSLLGEGIGSLDLIRILPDSRKFLRRPVSIFELISADTAANLIADSQSAGTWLDADTAVEIQHDLDALAQHRTAVRTPRTGSAILVLGASGILGTGFAAAILDLKRSGVHCPDFVVATRSPLPAQGTWDALRSTEGVRIEQLSADFGGHELDALVRDTDAGTVINCIGNTNVLIPYRELRTANVDLVSALVDVCTNHGARLVHLSTFVVDADVTATRVTDPRTAPYPYAASKSIAELIVTGAPLALDYTVVRLPRVLGEEYQLRDSADVLVSVVDGCRAVQAYPALSLTEEVTTGRAAAGAILRLVPELAGTTELGRGIVVLRGEATEYAALLNDFALDELDVVSWKQRLDDSQWARQNPRRWSVVDGWLSLGMALGGRTYSDYLTDYPTIPLAVQTVAEISAPTDSIATLLARD